MAKILVIEDDVTTRFAVVKALRKGGHDVAEASSISEARKHVADTAFEMVLTDLRLSIDDDGIEYIRELREGAEAFDGVIVAMTGNASVDSAVKAMRHGADDYLTKPLVFEELALSVPRWLEQRTLRQRVRLYERLERSRTEEFEALGNSPAWLARSAWRRGSHPSLCPRSRRWAGRPRRRASSRWARRARARASWRDTSTPRRCALRPMTSRRLST